MIFVVLHQFPVIYSDHYPKYHLYTIVLSKLYMYLECKLAPHNRSHPLAEAMMAHYSSETEDILQMKPPTDVGAWVN